MDDILAELAHQVVLPVLRSGTAEQATSTARGLAVAGGRIIELTTSTPGWPDAIAALAGEQLVGLGTVTSVDEARVAIDSGARFLVSPFAAPQVREFAHERGILFIEGGFTPAELSAVGGNGVVKLFPAHLGGPRYLRSLAPVLPGLRVIPTGGITWDDVEAWTDAGAFAVGIGSGLDLPADDLARAFARVRRADGP